MNLVEKEVFEYIENDQSTWRYQELPDIPDDFSEGLVRVAGLNRHGKPNLRVVKGNIELSDKAETSRLKYSCGYSPIDVAGYRYKDADGVYQFTTNVDDLDPTIMIFPEVGQEELGLLRYVIEKWISPEELEAQHRFSQRYGEGDLDPTLREFPRKGVYDLYLVVESAKEKFRKLDKDVLNFIKMKWKYEQKRFIEREADREVIIEKQLIAKEKRQAELLEAAVNFDLKLDKEEKEKRQHYWATKDDYEADSERYKNTATFYQNI